MRWNDFERSSNVEDRRNLPNMGPIGAIGSKSSIIVVLIVLVAGYYGVDLTGLLDQNTAPTTVRQQNYQRNNSGQADDTLADFTKVVLRQTELLWQQKFQQIGRTYQPPILVLYRGTTHTACGKGEAAIGPFYCPKDHRLYIDLSFYNDMRQKLGGGGDFALGYVVAHEVGHHVQNLLGTNQSVRQQQQGQSQRVVNKLSVMQELQADCYAGIWGNYVKNQGRLEIDDLDEALNTASAIGDDRLQRMSRGVVVPDSFTHGTSAERVYWFKRGFSTGNPAQCNTFTTRN